MGINCFCIKNKWNTIFRNSSWCWQQLALSVLIKLLISLNTCCRRMARRSWKCQQTRTLVISKLMTRSSCITSSWSQRMIRWRTQSSSGSTEVQDAHPYSVSWTNTALGFSMMIVTWMLKRILTHGSPMLVWFTLNRQPVSASRHGTSRMSLWFTMTWFSPRTPTLH